VTGGTGVQAEIGGETAAGIDAAAFLGGRTPLVIGAVIVLAFLLLMAVFRSVLVPLKAAVVNLLSIGAAYGVMVAVFQWGWLGGIIGIGKTGPIDPWIPLVMFTILFGLSMDYEVFLVARIYEEWHRTHDNQLAVTRGLAATGRTISAAATIMILVFGSFILGGERIIEMFGLGLASAVLLDALIVRSIIVPGLMLILGKANWTLPQAIDRVLPHLNVEGSVTDDPITPVADVSTSPELVGAGR
jgi:RND superfamily putative drug exporter